MRVETGGWHVLPELPARVNGGWRQWRRCHPRLTWSQQAGTGAIFWLLRQLKCRNTQNMALNRAKTTGNPYGNASHPGTDMDSHFSRI
jgi:hypothetical protein